VVVTLAALNGLFLFGNGLFMLLAPSAWYHFVPGVTHTGSFTQHFVRDIGLIQMFLGAAFGVGIIRPASRFELWAAATSWLIAHAALHLWEVAVVQSFEKISALHAMAPTQTEPPFKLTQLIVLLLSIMLAVVAVIRVHTEPRLAAS